MADQPVVDYIHKKDKRKGSGKGKSKAAPVFGNVSEAAALNAQSRLEQMRASGRAVLDKSQFTFGKL